MLQIAYKNPFYYLGSDFLSVIGRGAATTTLVNIRYFQGGRDCGRAAMMNSILSLGSLCQSESAHRGAGGVPLAAFTPGPASISPKAVVGMGILSSPPQCPCQQRWLFPAGTCARWWMEQPVTQMRFGNSRR